MSVSSEHGELLLRQRSAPFSERLAALISREIERPTQIVQLEALEWGDVDSGGGMLTHLTVDEEAHVRARRHQVVREEEAHERRMRGWPGAERRDDDGDVGMEMGMGVVDLDVGMMEVDVGLEGGVGVGELREDAFPMSSLVGAQVSGVVDETITDVHASGLFEAHMPPLETLPHIGAAQMLSAEAAMPALEPLDDDGDLVLGDDDDLVMDDGDQRPVSKGHKRKG